MRRRYLNRKDRETFYIFFAFKEFILNMMGSDSYFATDANRSLAKTIEDATEEITENITLDVDQTTVVQILKESDKMEVVAKYKAQAMREADDVTKQNEAMLVKTDDFYDVLEFSFMQCKRCRKKNKNVEACNLRRICMGYAVPPFEEEPEEGCCQYKQKTEKGDKKC